MSPDGRRRISSAPLTLADTRCTRVDTGVSAAAGTAIHASRTGSTASTTPLMPSTSATAPATRPSQRWISLQPMQLAPSRQLEAQRLDVLLAGLRLARLGSIQRHADLGRA